MKNILVDSSFWFTASFKNDSNHQLAIDWIKKNSGSDYRWVTTWIVLCEAFFLIKNRVSFQAGVGLLDQYKQSKYDIFNIEDKHSARTIDLLNKYEDRDVDLADISLVLAAEHYETADILTFDRNDFSVMRWERNRKFNLLLQK